MSFEIHPQILRLPVYKAGQQIKDKALLMSNENALGTSPAAIHAIQTYEASHLAHRYPPSLPFELLETIGKVHGLDPNKIAVGNGSDELISTIAQLMLQPGREGLYSQYGFAMYPVVIARAKAEVVSAPEKNLRTDVDSILAKVTPQTRVVYLANPNNPTGTYINADELKRLRQGLDAKQSKDAEILLVIDSAYAEFVTAPDYSDGSELAGSTNNTLMLRTLSKAYGLANKRVGWAYSGNKELVDLLNYNMRLVFNLTGSSIVGAIAALNDRQFLKVSVDYNTEARQEFYTRLQRLDYDTPLSQGNFQLVNVGDGEAGFKFFLERGVVTRGVGKGSYDLPQHLRITIGKPEEMALVYKILEEYRSRMPAKPGQSI